MRRCGFDLADVFEFFDNVIDDFPAFFNVREFSSAEDHGDHDLVFVGEEGPSLIDLEGDIVIASLRSNSDLLDLAVVRVAFGQPLLLLILEFAVVHDPANRRPFIRRDFDQIEFRLASARKRFLGRHDAQQFSVAGNDSHRRNANLLINPLVAFYTRTLFRLNRETR